MNILAVIPARAGSKGIPRKNVRMLNGQPLICYSIKNALASKYITHIVVSTDDVEIINIAKDMGVSVINRDEELCRDNVTLDAVINNAYIKTINDLDIEFEQVITLQPTSPLLESDCLDNAIEEHIKFGYDTTISAVNDPHLSWGEKDNKIFPLYETRLNRQYLPKHYKETGAFVITKAKFVKPNSRFGKKISIYAMPSEQAVDIDTWQDWILAESFLKRKRILFRVDAYSSIGTGHIYRCLLLAYNLTEHNVIFCLSKKSDLGIKKIQDSFFKYYVIDEDDEVNKIIVEENVDIIINDILDTDESYIKKLRQHDIRIVNFEDEGSGTYYADAVINALYRKKKKPNYYCGYKYYCLRDEFLRAKKYTFSENVKNVLVLFGGTDPCDLTKKTFDIIKNKSDIKFTFVIGLGYPEYDKFKKECEKYSHIAVVKNVKNISNYMKNADLAISSQGRTMFELAYMNVPTIVVSQNEREQEHIFGDMSNGFINLGSGTELNEKSLNSTIDWLVSTPCARKSMYEKMRQTDLSKGLKRVKKIILGEE